MSIVPISTFPATGAPLEDTIYQRMRQAILYADFAGQQAGVAAEAAQRAEDAAAEAVEGNALILRNDLKSTDAAKGVTLVGRAAMVVDSIDALLALPAEARRGDVRFLVTSYYSGWSVESPYVGPRGGGEFYWHATSTAEANGGTILAVPGVATGRYMRRYSGAVDVTWFGVDCTGSENAIDGVRKAVRWVGETGGGTVHFPTGEYMFTPGVDGYGVQIRWDNINIDFGPGAVLRLVDPERHMRALGAIGPGLFHVGAPISGVDSPRTVAENTWGYNGYNYYQNPQSASDPDLVVPPYVVANIAKGDREIHLNTVDGITPGAWLYLRSNDFFIQPGDPHQTLRTQLVRVRSVDEENDVVETDIHAIDDFDVETPGRYCLAIPLRFINNVSFTGQGRLIGPEYITREELPNNGEGECGIKFDYFLNGSVEGSLTVEMFPNAQVRHDIGVNFSASGLTMAGYRLPDQDGNPKSCYYGLTARGTQYTRYSNIFGRNLRNTCDTGIANLLSRQVTFQNIQCVGNHAIGVTTHSVVDCIVDTVISKDCAGGFYFRGVNLIANNLDLTGHWRDVNGTGGITIGSYQGGDDNLGDPDTVAYNFGEIILNNIKINGCSEPIKIDGSVEKLIITNVTGTQISELKNFMRLFVRRIGYMKVRNMIIDASAQSDGEFAWAISFWKWTATLAERGVIDIQDCTFINPSAGGILIEGVHLPDNLEWAGDFILKNNNMVLSGDKQPPWALYRLASGYVASLNCENSQILGDGTLSSTGVPLQILVPYGNILKGVPNNNNIHHRKNATGSSFTTPWDYAEVDGMTFTMGQTVRPYLPIAGYTYEQICTQSGTTGTFSAIGTIIEGSHTLTLQSASEGSLRLGQWLHIPSAGSETGFTPLRAIVTAIDGNEITLSDPAVNDATNVAITYQAPVLVDMSIVGQQYQGDESPYGRLQAPRGALYHQTEPDGDRRTAWLATDWGSEYAWEPMHSAQTKALLARIYAETLVKRLEGDADVGRVSRNQLFANLSTWRGAMAEAFSVAVLPVQYDDTKVLALRPDLSVPAPWEWSRDSGGYTTFAGGAVTLATDEPSIKDWKRYIRPDLNSRAADVYALEFQGSYNNILGHDIGSWQTVNASLTDAAIPSPIGVGDNFHWFNENTTSGNHTVYRTTGVPAQYRGTCHFSVYVYCPDLELMEDREIYLEIKGFGGVRKGVYYDLSDPAAFDFDDAGWPSLELVGESVYRLSAHVENDGGSVAGIEVSVRTILNGNFVFVGDTVNRFALSNPVVTDLRDTVRYVEPTGADEIQTAPDALSSPDFDLSQAAIAIDLYAKWTAEPYRMLAVGDHEIWSTEYRDDNFDLDEGLYYRNNHTDTLVPLTPLEGSGFPLLRNGRLVLTIDDGMLRIASLGVERLVYEIPEGTDSQGLTIGGSVDQNFLIGQVVLFDHPLEGYDLGRASELE